MKTLKQFKTEQMKNPEFAKEYEAIQPELDVIRAIIDARTSRNMTLKRLAEGMGMALKIEFVPKQKVKSDV